MKQTRRFSLLRLALVITLFTLFTSGCVVGPLVSHETARTVGEGHNELIGGYGMAGLVVKWNYGLARSLDIGAQVESLSMGVRAKYAFLNNDKGGWSAAVAAGMGASVGGSHYYGDLMGSYLAGKWEPYGTLRFVHVKIDPVDFRDKSTGEVDFTVNLGSYDYGQVIAGTRYWFDQNWLLSLEASSLFATSSGLTIGHVLLVGAGLGYHF